MQEIWVDAASESAARRDAPRRLPLSVCAMTGRKSSSLAATLALLRPLASEIVVALDQREEDAAETLSAVADEVVLFPHREPADSLIPWLHAQCGGHWILNLDDDEVPSGWLVAHLPELLEAEVTHWWLPRRWLFGGIETFLEQAPWVPDYQLRLYRNDPATLRFSDEFHRPVVVSGAAGFAREPLWHLDCVLNSFERRREKAIRYERERRGMRIAGVAHNSGLYLPELQPAARTAPVPEADRRLIRSVLDASSPPTRERRGAVRRASRDEIDELWPGEPFDPSIWTGRLTQLGTLDALPAGCEHTVTVAVQNDSRVVWRHGPDAAPLIQVGTRWLDEDGAEASPGLHTALPADLRPGRSLALPVHVRAPSRPGRYRLLLDLVHEHVRWFERSIEWSVDVVPARRVALIGHGEPLELALDRLQLEPELEPILVERDATVTPERFGHKRVPGLGDYLLAGIAGRIGPAELVRLCARTVKLLRRARRLRAGKPSAPLPHGAEECLVALAACERLLVAGPGWEPDAALTRQLWQLAATTAAAHRLGLVVQVDRTALTATGPLDRLLARLVQLGDLNHAETAQN